MKIKTKVEETKVFNIKANTVYDSEFDEEVKLQLCDLGFAFRINDEDVKCSEVDDYTEGKSYPNYMLVFKDKKIYRADVGEGNFTSTTFIYSDIEGEPSEWVEKT